MPKTKKVLVKAVEKEVVTPTVLSVPDKVNILPITQEFGNGDMNTLRDKINEIIKSNS